MCNRGKTPGPPPPSGGLAATADEVCERPYRGSAGHPEPGAEVVPEGDAELTASLAEAEECVPAVAAGVAAGAAADGTLGHLAADVVFRAVGVQRNVRMVEHHEQLGLVGVQPLEQAIQRGEARAAPKDAIEAGAQLAAASRRRIQLVGFQVGIEPPDQSTDTLLGAALLVGERLQLVHQAFGVDPAQAVLADVELPGVVADDDRIGTGNHAFTAPHSAPSVATRTGSGVTSGPVRPSCSRCSFQASSSANSRGSCVASFRTSDPARSWSRM